MRLCSGGAIYQSDVVRERVFFAYLHSLDSIIINRITFYSVHSCSVLFIGSDLHLTNKEPK